jgi:hypothetical protein
MLDLDLLYLIFSLNPDASSSFPHLWLFQAIYEPIVSPLSLPGGVFNQTVEALIGCNSLRIYFQA